MRHNDRPLPRLMAATGVMLILLCLIWPVSPSFGYTLWQNDRQDDGLPDRPDVIELPSRPRVPKRKEPIKGGHIELHISPAAEIWTEVEWQGENGQWYVVSGWRGYATKQGIVRWHFLESQLNKGPFRWQIYLYEDGDHLATSEPFYLPYLNGELVVVKQKVPALASYLYP
jgi:hypothetical protein